MELNTIAYLKDYFGFGFSFTIEELAEELGYDISKGDAVLITGIEIYGDTPSSTYYNVKHLASGQTITGISGVHLEQ